MRIQFASLLTLVLAALPMSASVASADGNIAVRVSVDGEDRSGGEFTIVVLPADIKQPIAPEEAQNYAVTTNGNRLELKDLEPGKYLVAAVIPRSQLKTSAPTSVEVQAPEWVRSSSGVQTGRWPAFEIEIKPDTIEIPLVFERKGYPPLPENFVVPHTAEHDLVARGSRPDYVRAAGFAVIGASLSLLAYSWMRGRRARVQ